MVLVVVSTAIAMVLALSFMSVQATTVNLSNNIRQAAHARALAESGLAMVVRYINNTSTWQALNTPGTWVNKQTFLGGSLNVKVVDGWDNNGDGVITGNATQFVSTDAATITVTATYKGASYSCQAVMMPQTTGASMTMGVISLSSVTISGGSLVDSFDSGQGAYGASNHGSNAQVGTNLTTNGSVVVTGSGILNGSAYIAPGGNPSYAVSVSGGGIYSGSTQVMANAISTPTITVPNVGASQGSVNVGYGTTTYTSNMHVSSLTLGGGGTLRISGNITIVCDGQFNSGNGASMEILPGSSVKLYCSGATINGGSAVVDGLNQSRMTIFNTGNGAVTVNNGAIYNGVIMSPRGPVSVYGSGVVYGAVLGSSLSVTNSGTVHQDTRITSGTDNVPIPGSSGATTYLTRWALPF